MELGISEESSEKESSTQESGSERPVEKSIGFYGSCALISNNICGPAMMGLPHLIQSAGIIPFVLSVIIVCLCSSLNATLLADSISSLPKNRDFSRPIGFSTGFKYIVGKKWFALVEILFLLSCFVQACAAIVETAQSIDQFLASFLIGSSYGIQVIPSIKFIQWSPTLCHVSSNNSVDESSLLDCSPFRDSGPLIITVGFVLTAFIFLPFGLANFKETILIQFISFGCLFVSLSQFFYEFYKRGLAYADLVPLYGDNTSQLVGVVLFNYAFAITIPSWLNEKKSDVSVNKAIWTSTSICTIIYLTFSILAAISFDEKSPNMLVLLASNKVSRTTQLYSALFGVMIIGCGVPTFCIMIRSSLFYSNTCSKNEALFIGSYLPYALSWVLYQGSILIHLLNWTGLVVNGSVAFVLPLILTFKAIEKLSALDDDLKAVKQIDHESSYDFDKNIDNIYSEDHLYKNFRIKADHFISEEDKTVDIEDTEKLPLKSGNQRSILPNSNNTSLFSSSSSRQSNSFMEGRGEIEEWEEIPGMCASCFFFNQTQSYEQINDPIEESDESIQMTSNVNNTGIPSSGDNETAQLLTSDDQSDYLNEGYDTRLKTNTTKVNFFSRLKLFLCTDSRLKYLYPRTTVLPIPSFINMKYKKLIVSITLCIFLSIILSNIAIEVYKGVSLPIEGTNERGRRTQALIFVRKLRFLHFST